MIKTCRICKRKFRDLTKPGNARTCRRKRCKTETVRLRVAKFRRLDSETAER